MTGQERITTERRRQIEREGYSPVHDDEHPLQEFLDAAASYASCLGPEYDQPTPWPWEPAAWKPKDRLRNLERAGALYLAAAEHAERHGGSGDVYRGAAEGMAKMIDELLSSVVKKTYIKITFSDNDWCICEPKNVASMTVDAEGYKTEEVQMTEAEFNALPEF